MARRGARQIGTVKRLVSDKGFGFIAVEGTVDDYFFHSTGCAEGVRFVDLQAGTKVSFVVASGPKGPRAEDVMLA
jgi:CspA family cold shock protein